MSELWKETFHDSDSYISLLFDNYFKQENVAYRYDGDKLIAMLLGIEYWFDSCERVYTGMYLCGLATRPEYRGRGIISALMCEIENRAKSRLIDFTFLIPADNDLRRFYNKRGYENMSQKYSVKYRFYGDKIDDNNLEKVSEYKDGMATLFDKWERGVAASEGKIYLNHTAADCRVVVDEWLLSGGSIFMDVVSERMKMVDADGEVRMRVPFDRRSWIPTGSGEMYGMMKGLRGELPPAENFSIDFMLD